MADAWGGSFGTSWGLSWTSTAAAASTAVTTAGPARRAGATSWAPKTLSELREEKRQEIARLKRLAKRRVNAAIRDGETDLVALQTIAEQRIEKALNSSQEWMNQGAIAQLAAETIGVYLDNLAIQQDEEDAEFLLLTMQ